MDAERIKQRLTPIFQDVFDDSALEVREDMTAKDVEAWDSLTHVDLIVAVEKEFKIKLTTAEVRKLQNVGDFIRLIGEKAA